MTEFTAHNILLKNGTTTMPQEKTLLASDAAWTSIAQTLDRFLPGTYEERRRLRAVDLGCLEGGYAVELAKLGFDTLGIEAREENLEKCNFVKNDLGLENLHFAKDDVRNLANYGKFDVVVCYGLLYHLNDPVHFLKIVGDCTNSILLLNTHFAAEFDLRYELGLFNHFVIGPIQKRIRSLEPVKNYRLSSLTTNEGYKGRWKKEYDKKSTQKEIEKSLWAAYNNHQSFWLTKKDLTKAMHAAGFSSVFEQFNYTGALFPENYTQYYSRTMFVGLK